MRIGLIIYGDINTISGGYLYDRKLVEFLRQHGDKVSIIGLNKTSYFKALISNSIPSELKDIKNHKFDILIQDELVYPSFWRINNKLKKLLKCPVVSLVHLLSSAIPNTSYKKLMYRTMEKRYLKSIDGLILNSEETLKQTNKLLQNKLPPNLIAVPGGNNFIEVETTIKNYFSKGLKILFVGNITQQKGLHVLIKAMCKLDNKNISLTVVGRDDLDKRYVGNLKKYIGLNELDEQIKFYGLLSGESLQEKYLENDIFVMPSVNEAYGIVFLEAMQYFLPVIGCKIGGAKEIIMDGDNGYLINPEDSDKLAELINLLNNDRHLLSQLSESARQKYLQLPTWDESINKIRLFLQELIKEKGSLFG